MIINRKNSFLFKLINIILILLILGILYAGYCIYTKSNKLGNIQIYSCIKLANGVCLSKDLGRRTDYREASTHCRRRGRTLPTLEDAWYIWISSENCGRAFSSNEYVPKDKKTFLKGKLSEQDIVPANDIPNYCNKVSSIKFPISSQYKGGNYWLNDSAEKGKHFVINYNTGKVSIQPDDSNEFGVRCVNIKD